MQKSINRKRTCKDCSETLVVGFNWTENMSIKYNYICRQCNVMRTLARRNNDQSYRVTTRLANKMWKRRNRGACNATNKVRNSNKIQRTPSWADLEAIKEIYKEAARLNNIHGPGAYHVDHIIPLQGKNVSGFHVEYNLQILKASDNLLKSNKYVQ